MMRSIFFKGWMGALAALAFVSLGVTGCSGSTNRPTGGTDAGMAQDSGSTSTDAGPTVDDAGSPADDAGVTVDDAGTTTDAGTTDTDAGTTDAGTTGIDAGPTVDAGPQTCTEITADMFAGGSHDGTAADYSANALPDTGDMSDPDKLSIQFYGSSFSPSNDGEKTGTFDLSMGADSNYGTCSRCVAVYQDPMAPGKVFFQQSGTLVVDPSSTQLTGTLNATLTDVTLVEVTIDDSTYASTPVPGGACLHLAGATVAVTPPPPPMGWTCDATLYGNGKCDCGCGAADSDCFDATVDSCDTCNSQGGCNMGNDCPGMINATNNAVCGM